MNPKVMALAVVAVALVAVAATLYAQPGEQGAPLQDTPVQVTGQDESCGDVFPRYRSDDGTSASAMQASDSVMITDNIKHSIPLEKIRGGGPPKDGIPSIDSPVFAPSDAQFISDSDVVIGLEIGGEARAYPLFILVWHEIVNDMVDCVPVSVTYCPLCYTNQVFERIIGGEAVEFGTSGKLYNSNLLMYDRLTESYWSQALGEAVKGELTGEKLALVPFDVITWGDWKKIHPETLVLTTDTGHIRSYATDPYGDYYTSPNLFFPIENEDERLHPKEVIIGFNVGGQYKAYAQSDIESEGAINDAVGGVPLVLVSIYGQNMRAFASTIDGRSLDFELRGDVLVDSETGSEWNYAGLAVSGALAGMQLERMPIQPGFWFEWAAFHPETLLYEVE